MGQAFVHLAGQVLTKSTPSPHLLSCFATLTVEWSLVTPAYSASSFLPSPTRPLLSGVDTSALGLPPHRASLPKGRERRRSRKLCGNAGEIHALPALQEGHWREVGWLPLLCPRSSYRQVGAVKRIQRAEFNEEPAFPNWLRGEAALREALARRGLNGHHALIPRWKRWALGFGPTLRHQRAITLVSCGGCGPSTPSSELALDDDLCQLCTQDEGVVFR